MTVLATQQTNIGTSSKSYTYWQILSAATLVVAPYDSTQVSIALAEIQTNGTTTGVLQWCKTTGPIITLCPGSAPIVPVNRVGMDSVIYVVEQYNHTPLNIWFTNSTIPLSESIYMAPRASTSIACCT